MVLTTNGKDPKTVVRPSSDYNLFCPFCDDWSTRDSMIGRKRLGQHIVNQHDDEVRWRVGETPPPLED
ncbi:hypothetical protein CL65_gp084 [Mycobacterium phage Patience]|uniref:Uncharacterized protein n=2 Tax=Patiencevirus patience TaxID=1982360 RepID=A0A0K1LS16_9CAUD|nr:hypothetical protein CL65_gp084 [Mycobacterium phage Patience]AEL97992.1 hypothetical protein PATIENCE_83 [Mycobacterium phage Patience]AKU45371.1 hypothetical protein MADRUGA_81 [Mycobacterium phage Madruga]UOW93407.1 hypothetical protein SEA_LABELLE_82 [Mycobacterium phage Labelle]